MALPGVVYFIYNLYYYVLPAIVGLMLFPLMFVVFGYHNVNVNERLDALENKQQVKQQDESDKCNSMNLDPSLAIG